MLATFWDYDSLYQLISSSSSRVCCFLSLLVNVRVTQYGELLSELVEFLHVGLKGADLFLAGSALRQIVTVRVDGTCAALVGAHLVLADAVDANDKSLIFNGSGA